MLPIGSVEPFVLLFNSWQAPYIISCYFYCTCLLRFDSSSWSAALQFIFASRIYFGGRGSELLLRNAMSCSGTLRDLVHISYFWHRILWLWYVLEWSDWMVGIVSYSFQMRNMNMLKIGFSTHYSSLECSLLGFLLWALLLYLGSQFIIPKIAFVRASIHIWYFSNTICIITTRN